MENANQALVDFIGSVQPAAGPTGAADSATSPVQPAMTAVSFSAGRFGLIDGATARGAAWARVLDSLQRARAPAYVEIDPVSAHITRLLVPLVVRVGDIVPAEDGDGVEVELVISHARHHLRAGNPAFDRLLAALQDARSRGVRVAVTETAEGHDIIAVTALREGSGDDALPPEPPNLAGTGIDAPPGEDGDVSAAAVVPLSQAQQLFELVNAKVCCPETAATPCIPFVYPDDGCWGRAHEMVRLMASAGVQADKVWIFGSLRVATSNNPRCEVRWGWHVAPTLQVDTGAGGVQTYVVDPSLFPNPVPRATWAGVQGDPNPALIASSGAVFWRNQSGSMVQTDPTYAQTDSVLETYRNQLRIRATGVSGPPPYLNCVPAQPGVQFYGSVPPGATHSWFTFGWPANWHVLWTVMPMTPCPGAPQLRWRTRVERASATQATYWIVVTNTTGSTIRFEGRYDVLSR